MPTGTEVKGAGNKGRFPVNCLPTSESIACLEQMGIELLEEGLTSDTKKAYSRVWQKLAEICCSLEKLDWAKLPISSHTLFLVLTHNFHEGKSGATIASSSSVIAYVHKLTGHRDPTNTQAIRNLIVSAQKKAPSKDVRCPINSFILKN